MDNTWADLSEAQQQALKAGLNGQSIYGLFWNDDMVVQYHVLQEAGLVRSGRITPKGRAVFEAGNPQADAGAAGVEGAKRTIKITVEGDRIVITDSQGDAEIERQVGEALGEAMHHMIQSNAGVEVDYMLTQDTKGQKDNDG